MPKLMNRRLDELKSKICMRHSILESGAQSRKALA